MHNVSGENHANESEAKCFLLWIAVWIVALAVLLPAIG
jgi:hypothetical protein